MSKHTPGPWEASKNWNFYGCAPHAVIKRMGSVEMKICGFTHSAFREDIPANSRLIAAAPKMYELLKNYVELGPDPGAFWDHASSLLQEIDNE